MRQFVKIIISFISIFLISIILVLSTTGLETKRFNNFISQKINERNDNLKINLKTIKFKLDIQNVSLFLDTKNPKIYYRNILIPSNSLKVYVDFNSIIKSDLKIKKITLNLDQINVKQFKALSRTFKPSNFTSFVNNKLIQGIINTEVDFYLDQNNLFNNFIIRGSVEDLKSKFLDNLVIQNTSFSFFADQTDILVKNFNGDTEFFAIKEGDLKAELSQGIYIDSNFKSVINSNGDTKKIEKFLPFLNKIKPLNIQADFNNNFTATFDNTYKLKNFNYKNNGNIKRANFNLLDLNLNLGTFFNEEINKLSLSNTEIKTTLNSKKSIFNLIGQYSTNDNKNLNFELNNKIDKEKENSLDLKLSLDYEDYFEINFLNYIKNEGDIVNFKGDLLKKKSDLKINQFQINEGKNSFILNDAKFSNGNFLSFDKLLVKTYKNGKKNNDFKITFNQNIDIKGQQLDASNFPKIFKKQSGKNILSKISKNIEINMENIIAPVSESLKNFKLIGRVENGEFIKISSKGEFGKNKFLDISLKNEKNNKKKYLEIYSDISKPLLSEYNFFEGLTGGNLLFSSVISENSSNSKLKIENFKVINAPGLIKLLSLADLGGLADLAEGDGLTFDLLEIDMEKNEKFLKLNEILALGPSMSVLMEGYQDEKGLTSLRGTLVPAKTLNKMISKIPVIGKIVIPKEVGEGLFGISFKMKGPKGKIKTTINPIRTLTPRFIQKIIDKKKIK